MLYTVIADYRKLLEEITNDEGEIVSPFSHFKSEIKEYIKRPKTKEGKLARLGGYLLLFHTVRFLFGKTMNFEIGFTEEGKPYFTSEEMKNLSFNISHSGGLCAVCLSEGKIGRAHV